MLEDAPESLDIKLSFLCRGKARVFFALSPRFYHNSISSAPDRRFQPVREGAGEGA